MSAAFPSLESRVAPAPATVWLLSSALLSSALLSSAFVLTMATARAGEPGVYGYEVPGIAEREIARRQQRVEEAEAAMARGDAFMRDKDYEAAISEYRTAVDLLPAAPATLALRRKAVDKFAKASVDLAEQYADEGRFDQSIALMEAVLEPNVDPHNYYAKRMLQRLDDPDWYSPALSPEHVARVQQVEQALHKAMGYFDLGDFDSAEREYFRVLNIDHYNTAARRGLEINEREKTEYFRSAYDETRARFMRQIMEQWETRVPDVGLEEVLGAQREQLAPGQTGVAYISAKLKDIVIPKIEFSDTPLVDAIAFLRQKSVELDALETNPARQGVNIIIREGGGGGGVSGEFGAEGAAAAGGASPRITLSLTNVPLIEALRYTTELAGMKYKIESFAVLVVPISDVGEDLFTKVFKVPPTFISGGADGGGGAAPEDPFAAPAEATTGTTLKARPTAMAVLQEKGISFPPGSSAFFNTATAQLIVRNTQSNMELIEAFVDSLVEEVQKQIYITSKFVEINQDNLHELGFDWLLGPFNIPGNSRTFGAGGTTGATRLTDIANSPDYVFQAPNSSFPVGRNPITSGLRSGLDAVNSDSIDDLLTDEIPFSRLAPGIFSVAGVFTDPQFQVVIRAIDQKKGVDLLSAPSVTTRSGQRAKMEVIREFIYPTEYDPPEIPDRVDVVSLGGLGGAAFPVTPATPTAFETRNTGVTLEVDPVIGADGYTIDLNLVPEVVEFEGFINYGSPIMAGNVLLTENRIEMPVFATRKVTTAVTIWDGQTVVIGGLIREDVQNVEDKVPIMGSLPAVGRFFQSKVDFHLKKNLTIFVTAKLIDPAGQTIRSFESPAVSLEEPIATNPLLGPPPR